MKKAQDLLGLTFGRLTVIEFDHKDRNYHYFWKCRCVCGNFHVASTAHLRGRMVQSCGCQNLESQQTRHGTLEEQFWAKVQKVEDEKSCWTWSGVPDKDGYGRIKHKRKMIRAHHVSWRLHFGEIPEGLQVLHHCDNPPCVRPDHLWLGTNTDNMRDKCAKGRWRSGWDTRRANMATRASNVE